MYADYSFAFSFSCLIYYLMADKAEAWVTGANITYYCCFHVFFFILGKICVWCVGCAGLYIQTQSKFCFMHLEIKTEDEQHA